MDRSAVSLYSLLSELQAEKWQATAGGRTGRSGSRIGAVSTVTHDDVIVPVNIAVLALTLVVVVALGAQRSLHVAPAISDVIPVKFHQYANFNENSTERFTENFIKFKSLKLIFAST